MTTIRSPRWEQRLLALCAYPANIGLGGVAAFLLALPLVTLLPAAIALARAFALWRTNGDDAVFTNTFREFAATWRRSIGVGILAFVSVALLAVDGVFLTAQLSSGSASLAVLFAAAAIPVAIVVGMALLAIPVAAARNRDGSMREWLSLAGHLIAVMPLRSLFLLAFTVAFLVTCLLLPTVLPFVGVSVPIFFAIITWGTASADVRRP